MFCLGVGGIGGAVTPSTHWPGSSPCVWQGSPIGSRLQNAPVAQLDRAPDYESGGQRFESFRARQFFLVSAANLEKLSAASSEARGAPDNFPKSVASLQKL